MFEGRMMYWGTRMKPVQEVIEDAMATDNVNVAMDLVDHLLNYAIDCTRDERMYMRQVCNDIRRKHGRLEFKAAPTSPANLPATKNSEAEEYNNVPACLRTPEAEELWQKLRDAGFIQPKGYQLAEGVSNNQATYIADRFAAKLQIKHKWKIFQELWDIRNMAQYAGNWNQTGKTPARDIDDAFR